MFVNGILTNAEVWYGLTDKNIKELEDLDRQLIRRVLKCPSSTPLEAAFLELGFLPLSVIIKQRRLTFLHYLVTSDPNKLLYKFFQEQWDNSTYLDWTVQARMDFVDIGLNLDISSISDRF